MVQLQLDACLACSHWQLDSENLMEDLVVKVADDRRKDKPLLTSQCTRNQHSPETLMLGKLAVVTDQIASVITNFVTDQKLQRQGVNPGS